MPLFCTSPPPEFSCITEKGTHWNRAANGSASDSISGSTETSSTHDVPNIPPVVANRLLDFAPDSHHALRLTCRSWSRAVDKVKPLSRPAGNVVPPEILQQIFYMLSPHDFDNARRICSQWMRVSLDQGLLESMLKRAGWWHAWQRDCQTQPAPNVEESLVWKMSKRFSTECLLSGRKMNVEKPGFLTTGVVDFSKLSQQHPEQVARTPLARATQADYFGGHVVPTSKFNVSMCGNYLLITSGSMIRVYRLLTKKARLSESMSLDDISDKDIALVANIPCSDDVVSAAIDTSESKFVVAALLRDRVGMVCDVTASSEDPESTMDDASRQYHYDVCSAEDPPRSVSICPGRRCVAFGGGSGIELRWVDQVSRRDCRKHFPMRQPSEILHFLPTRSEEPDELRLISSLAGPGVSSDTNRQNHENRSPGDLEAGVHSLTSLNPHSKENLSLVRATHCHHYRAIPVSDGLHILFIEPRTGFLCIGSDAPLGGPTNLTRALVCAPPFEDPSSSLPEGKITSPTVFAAGSDLSWGLRVVAAYNNRLVLYSVPLDVFSVIRKEHELQGDTVMADSDLARDWFLDSELSTQNQKRRGSLFANRNGDWEFLLSVSYRPTAMLWPLEIYGKEIGQMDGIVELALQSSFGGARVWAFGASGETNIIDVDTFTSPAQGVTDVPCKSLTVDADGAIDNARLVARPDESLSPRLGKESAVGGCFKGQHSMAAQQVVDESAMLSSSTAATAGERGQGQGPGFGGARRRPSLAACIVGFNIPELGMREGRWVENQA